MIYIKIFCKTLLIFTIAVFYIGCSSSLSGDLFKPVTNIPADRSVIYLYRPIDDKSTEFTITYNKREICVLVSGGYFPIYAEEGKVEISSSANFQMFVTGLLQTAGSTDLFFEAEPGKYYYVMGQTLESDPNKLSMKLVPENFGVNSIKECRLLEPITE